MGVSTDNYTLWISTDYTSGAPSTATWAQLAIPQACIDCAESALRIYHSSPYAIEPPKEQGKLAYYLDTGEAARLARFLRKGALTPQMKAAYLRSCLQQGEEG